MSAFVVEDKTINRIVTFMRDDMDLNGEGIGYNPLNADIDRPLCSLVRGLQSTSPRQSILAVALDVLGARMRDMSIAAVNYLYEDRDSDTLQPDYFFEPEAAAPSQVLKSLGCFLYQCNEGDVPKMDLYKRLERFRMQLAYDIATHTKEYDEAEWG